MKLKVSARIIVPAITSLVLLAQSGSVSAEEKLFGSPTANGMPIDRCVQGARWALGDPARCDKARQLDAANAFCRSVGYEKSTRHNIETHAGNHAIWTFPKFTPPTRGTFTQVAGLHRLKDILCYKSAPAGTSASTRSYTNPVVNGMRLDRCVQGDGWNLWDSARCDNARQRAAATAFCRQKNYASAQSWRVSGHVGNHAIWSFPRNSSSSRGTFTQTAGADAYSLIVCQR